MSARRDLSTAIVLFDIDGTLCDTSHVDDECYLAAVSEALGRDARALPWTDAPHRTDWGIMDFLWERVLGRPAEREERGRVRDAFVALLRAQLIAAPQRFRAIPGAPGMLRRLAEERIAAAVATGGWGPSARLKLEAAGLMHRAPLACADDSPDRAEIFALARARAAAGGRASFAEAILVGDGVWDAHTAARLGWRFLGVAAGAAAERLRGAGASDVVADFSDGGAVLAGLARCTVPGRGCC
jgi:phosphoglycolate phosphatase-like HAD superfamily hydrolase